MINQRFDICQKIGTGSFGDVFEAIDKRDDSSVAIKVSKRRPAVAYLEFRVYQ